MQNQTEQKEWLNKKLAQLAKELRKANTQFTENAPGFVTLKGVLTQLREIADKMENQPALDSPLEIELQNQQILELFSQLKTTLAGLKNVMLSMEEPILEQTVFLEKHRTYRHYSFEDARQALSFLNELAQTFDIKQFSFKPAFVGMVNFETVQKELELEKNGDRSFKIPVEKTQGLFEFLISKKFAANFRLDSPEIKILCKNSRELKIEAKNNTLKRIDRTALTASGKVLDN